LEKCVVHRQSGVRWRCRRNRAAAAAVAILVRGGTSEARAVEPSNARLGSVCSREANQTKVVTAPGSGRWKTRESAWGLQTCLWSDLCGATPLGRPQSDSARPSSRKSSFSSFYMDFCANEPVGNPQVPFGVGVVVSALGYGCRYACWFLTEPSPL